MRRPLHVEMAAMHERLGRSMAEWISDGVGFQTRARPMDSAEPLRIARMWRRISGSGS